MLNQCLRDFPHIGALRKEQNTCLVNLARGKNVFAILATGLDLPDKKKVTITEQSKEGVIYELQTTLTLSLDLFRRTSLSYLKSNLD